jgi:hypothetical protein
MTKTKRIVAKGGDVDISATVTLTVDTSLLGFDREKAKQKINQVVDALVRTFADAGASAFSS